MIKLLNIKKSVKGILLYDRLSIEIQENSFFVINCKDGEGKTTLTKIIKKMTTIDDGCVEYDGINENDIYAVFDNIEKNTYYRVNEYIEFYAKLNNVPSHLINEKIDYYLDKYNLLHLKFAEFDNLDKSTKKILSILISIICDKKVVIFDSPYNILTEKEKNIFNNILKDECQNMTVILLTNSIDDFLDFATHIAIIERGKCLVSGEKNFVLREYGYKSYIEIVTENEAEHYINIISNYDDIKDLTYEDNKIYIQTNKLDNDYELLKFLIDNNISVNSFKREIKK